MSRSARLAAFLDGARVADPDGMVTRYPGIYILGCADARVSFHAQQVRAINLVSALEELYEPSSKKICVIGGGIAGTTAACYALERGFKVALLEKNSRVLSLQAGSVRWVHPNIYDWPRPGWSGEKTMLPVMNWSAGTALQVLSSLRQQWQDAVLKHQPEVYFRAEVNLLQRAEAWTVGWRDGSVRADLVILAVGFGEETEFPNIDSRGYWINNDFDRPLRQGGIALISGTGDGGLIDTMRICFHDFQHQRLLEIGHELDQPELTSTLIKIEQDYDRYGSCEALTAAYETLVLPSALVDKLRRESRDDVTAILNAKAGAPFDRSSAILHRTIVSALMKLGRVQYKAGRIDPATIGLHQGGYPVALNEDTDAVNLVVVRHGPQPALKAFPEIYSLTKHSFAHNRQHRTASDNSRHPLWEVEDAPEDELKERREAGQSPAGEKERPSSDPSDEADAAGATSPVAKRRYLERLRRIAESAVWKYCTSISRSTIIPVIRNDELELRVVLEPGGDHALPRPVNLRVLVRLTENGADVYAGGAESGDPPLVGRGWRKFDEESVVSALEKVVKETQTGGAL